MIHQRKIGLLRAAIALQGLSLLSIVAEILIESYGDLSIRIPWDYREYVEIAAILGLSTGLIFGFAYIRDLRARNFRVEGQLRVVSGEFHQLLTEHFDQWGLSKSEKDVAYFAIKGLSNHEISDMRGTSEGTIKAQLNAVYKKAGLESRTQLLGYFIEELMASDQDADQR